MRVNARSSAFVAMGCSGITILGCIFVVPLIHTQLHQWTARFQIQIKIFKARTDDSWNKMMIMRRDMRLKRRAGFERDFLDEIDDDILAEFGPDDFLDSISSSPRSLADRVPFGRPEPSDPGSEVPTFGDFADQLDDDIFAEFGEEFGEEFGRDEFVDPITTSPRSREDKSPVRILPLTPDLPTQRSRQGNPRLTQLEPSFDSTTSAFEDSQDAGTRQQRPRNAKQPPARSEPSFHPGPASAFEDVADQLDEDIFAEFGEEFGSDEFFNPLPSSATRSRGNRPKFTRPKPSLGHGPFSFGHVADQQDEEFGDRFGQEDSLSQPSPRSRGDKSRLSRTEPTFNSLPAALESDADPLEEAVFPEFGEEFGRNEFLDPIPSSSRARRDKSKSPDRSPLSNTNLPSTSRSRDSKLRSARPEPSFNSRSPVVGDVANQVDEDVSPEFGDDFGNDDFFEAVPTSSHLGEDRPRAAHTDPSFDPRQPSAFKVADQASATRKQRRREEQSGPSPDGNRLASPRESSEARISENMSSGNPEVTKAQGSVKSGYTALPEAALELASRNDNGPSSSAGPAFSNNNDPLARQPTYKRPDVPAHRPSPQEDPYSRPQPQPSRKTYEKPPPEGPRYTQPKSQCNCKKLSCPAGPPGDTGIPGRHGRQGLAGTQGLAGLDGPHLEPIRIDLPCTTCLQGPRGRSGNPGNSGDVGGKGWSGQNGVHGRDGSPGSMGGKGPIGAVGPKGKSGYKGLPGLDLIGGTGKPGKKGSPGATGPRGRAGKSGMSFYHAGPAGSRGVEGAKGREGVIGIPGLPGSNGERGEVGVDVAFCPCPKRGMRPYYQTPDDEKDQ